MSNLNSLTCNLDGINLVEAAAGTGKTYNIQNLVVRFILEKELSIENIVVVTFTEAAADELRSRLRAVINACCEAAQGKNDDARALSLIQTVSREKAIRLLTMANMDFDRAAIGTLHGFCQRLLKDFAFESGNSFNTELLPNAADILDSFALDAFRHFCYHHPFSELYVHMLILDTARSGPPLKNSLQKLVRIKNARKDLTLLPQYQGPGSLASASENFQTLMQEFRAVNIADILTDLKALTNGTFVRYSSWEKKLRPIQEKPYPAQKDIENLKDFLPTVASHPKKGKEDELAEHLQNTRFFSLITDICALWSEVNLLLRDAALEHALSRFEEFKKQNNWITYDDMLIRASQALENPAFVAGIQQKFSAGIIDEFQDTDPIQWQIFHTIFEKGPLFLVGDPRQAIYSFRGGDLATYLEARQSASACYTLTTNYRSCDKLLEQINIWFSDHPNGFAAPEIKLPKVQAPAEEKAKTSPLLINNRPDPNPLKIINCAKGQEFQTAAQLVSQLLAADDTLLPLKNGQPPRKLRPEDIAVLAYKGKELQEIKKELSRLNIPSVIQKSGNVFSTRSGEELQKILYALLNISKSSAVRWALTTTICGLSLKELSEEEKISQAIDILVQLKKTWEERSFQAMFKKLLTEFNTELRLAGTSNGLRHMTDLSQIGDLLHQTAAQRQLSPQALYDHLIYCRSLPDDSEAFAAEQETDQGAVILCTEHKSKGLQYPVVILPSLNTVGHLPDTYHKDGKIFSGFENPNDQIFLEDEFLQENLRRGYVALTRAENACFVIATPVHVPPANGAPRLEKKLTTLNWLWCKRNSNPSGSPSVFLKNCTPDDRVFLEQYIMQLPDESVPYEQESSSDKLAVRELQNSLAAPLLTTSFTGIAPGHSGGFVPPDIPEKEDDENTGDEGGEPPAALQPEKDPLRRLKGKTFGLLLHGILERMDFKADEKTIRQWVEREIRLNAPTEEELEYCTLVIAKTLEKELTPDLRIRDIRPDKRCAEMKFDFSFNNEFQKGDLRRLAAEHLQAEYEKHSDDKTTFHSGFFTGFIDLFFEHNGKYYILDWKSNLLPDYSQKMLKASVSQSFYQMQYLIYLAAVIRFLKQRLNLPQFTEAEYEKYIGGVFYIYMRGAVSDDPAGGVFFDRPDFACIEKILEVLK